MSLLLVITLFAFCAAVPSGKPNIEPEYLEMLRATGQDEEFAKLMGIDVSLVRPNDERSEEDIIFTKVSDLGDILLTPEQEEQARQGIRFSRHSRYRWPNEIPYVISETDFSDSQVAHIRSSINALNNKLRRLQIVPRNRERDYVLVISGRGCYSYLGRIGGEQVLSLQRNGCLRAGTIQHEFIHAAGFTHEHNRPDRDNHVRVLFENIPSEWRSQYQKVSSNDFDNIDRYDYHSVMHYPLNVPGSDKPAFEILDPNVNKQLIGQRTGPTDTDIKKVDILYS